MEKKYMKTATKTVLGADLSPGGEDAPYSPRGSTAWKENALGKKTRLHLPYFYRLFYIFVLWLLKDGYQKIIFSVFIYIPTYARTG